MPTYTVKSGDTLGAIAGRYGVPLSSVSGYRSGNPNLIFPGEVLSIGGKPSAPAAKPTSTAKPAPKPGIPTSASIAQGVNQTQVSEVKKLFDPFTAAQTEYETALGRLENPYDIYKGLETEQGVPQRQEQIFKLREQTDNLTNLLDTLDEDVTSRLSGTLTTAAQRNRVVAAEGQPIRENLGRLGTVLTREEQNLNDVLGRITNLTQLKVAGQEQGLRPFESRLEGLRFTIPQQTELLRDRLTREFGSKEADRLLKEAKAAEEREFARQKELERMRGSYSSSANQILANLLAQQNRKPTEPKPAKPAPATKPATTITSAGKLVGSGPVSLNKTPLYQMPSSPFNSGFGNFGTQMSLANLRY